MTDPVVERVIAIISKRSSEGQNKYKTGLDRKDLSLMEWLQHLQEELLDAALYVERLKEEYDTERG